MNEFDENVSNRNVSNKNRFKSDVFSISGAIKKVNVAKATKSKDVNCRAIPEIKGRTLFNADKVKEMLDKYVGKCKDSALIANLTAHNFKLEGNTIILFVDNDLQIKEMNSKLSSIQYQFAKLLNNGDVKLSISLSDESMKEDKKRFYTKEEIYNLFKKENPFVEDLKNFFDLDIDYK